MAISDGSVIINTRMDTGGFGKGVNLMQKKVGGLTRSVAKLGAVIGSAFAVVKLVQFGKEALELGSDLQEVQNVVDVTFTNMSDSVNEFAKNAAEAAGLSETMAKRYVGTFGAMAKAFGFAEEEAFNMSTSLTQLAGDVASFYNITQDEAYTKLKSVFTGETETLKDLGVVMTQNALDSYAMAKGYGKTTSKMSEQEKVALRYSFVLDQLSAAQGDFARTSDSWANQTRILSLNFDSFKANIGQALINVFTPFLKVINQIVSKMAQLSQQFIAFSELLVGKSTSGGGGSPGDALSDISSGYDDITDATEEAAKAQKQYVTGLDEIRTFDSKASSQDVSKKDGSVIDPQKVVSEEANTEISKRLEDIANRIKSVFENIKNLFGNNDWEGLGKYVADGLNKAMAYIYDILNWDNIRKKIEPFIKGISGVFNSFVSEFDWELLGKIIGAGINTIVNTLNLFFESIDWIALGMSIATALNGMVEEINWENIGKLIGNKIMFLWDMAKGFVETIDFDELGTSIGKMVNGALKRIDLGQMVETLFKFAIGILEMLTSAINEIDWSAVGRQIANALKAIDWIGLAKGLWNAGLALINGLLEAFGELPGPVKVVIALFAGFLAASKIKEIVTFVTGSVIPAFVNIIDTAKNVAAFFSGTLIPAIKNVAAFLGSNGILVLAIVALIGIIVLLVQNWDKVTEVMRNVANFISSTFSRVWTSLTNVLKTFGSFLSDTFQKAWKDIFGNSLSNSLSNFLANCKTIFEAVKRIFASIITFISGTFANSWKNAWNGIVRVFANIWTTIVTVVEAVFNVVIAAINGLLKGINAVTGIVGIPEIKSVPKINVPKLANGAVIPPNAPFMAVLGDQKRGTNIEAPLDTIKQAVREVVGEGGNNATYHFVAQLNRQTLFEQFINQSQLIQMSTGINPLELT